MASMQLRFTKKEQLVEALKARRSWAEQHDKNEAREHRAKEDAALKAFKDECKKFGQMSLTRLKETVEKSTYREMWPDLPSCPMSAVAKLDDVLAALAITHQETFVLNGDYKDPIPGAHWLLTHDDAPKKRTVCA